MTEFFLGEKADPFFYVRFEGWKCLMIIAAYYFGKFLFWFIDAWITEYRSKRLSKSDKEKIWLKIKERISHNNN